MKSRRTKRRCRRIMSEDRETDVQDYKKMVLECENEGFNLGREAHRIHQQHRCDGKRHQR